MSSDGNDAFLASAVATRRDRRQAFAVMAVLVVAFIATVPMATWRVPAVPQFVRVYDTEVFVLDTLAAVLLYAQFEHLRRRSLLALACAYVFTPLVVAADALSVPNAPKQKAGTRASRCCRRRSSLSHQTLGENETEEVQ